MLDHAPVVAVGVQYGEAAKRVIGDDADVVRLDLEADHRDVASVQVRRTHRRDADGLPQRRSDVPDQAVVVRLRAVKAEIGQVYALVLVGQPRQAGAVQTARRSTASSGR